MSELDLYTQYTKPKKIIKVKMNIRKNIKEQRIISARNVSVHP